MDSPAIREIAAPIDGDRCDALLGALRVGRAADALELLDTWRPRSPRTERRELAHWLKRELQLHVENGRFQHALAGAPWKPAIFMPRIASRLTLTVTDIRVVRLQAISTSDAKEEGWSGESSQVLPIDWYSGLWDSIHGVGSWSANPWVATVNFMVEPRNIDA